MWSQYRITNSSLAEPISASINFIENTVEGLNFLKNKDTDADDVRSEFYLPRTDKDKNKNIGIIIEINGFSPDQLN